MNKKAKIIIGILVFMLFGAFVTLNDEKKKHSRDDSDDTETYGPTAPVPDGFRPTIIHGPTNPGPRPTFHHTSGVP